MTIPARDTPATVIYMQSSIAVDDSFNITFPFLGNDEYIKVSLRMVDETIKDLVLDEDFSIITTSGEGGVYGVCVFLGEHTDVKRICIERAIENDQGVMFNSQTVFTETTETALDKITMLAQDFKIKEYTLHAPEDEVVLEGSMTLPPANVRANKYLYFDTFGSATVGYGEEQSKALRQAPGEEADPTFVMGFIDRREKGIMFDADAHVVLTPREKILNEHLVGGKGINVDTPEGASETTITAQAGDNILIDINGISAPKATNDKLGVVKAGTNTSIGENGEVNAINTTYSAGNGISVSEAGVISAVAGDNVTVDGDGISVAVGSGSNLGVVQVGTNLSVTEGVVSVSHATNSTLGVVKAGTNTSIGAGGEVNAVDTTYSAGNGLQLSSGVFSAKAGTNVTVNEAGINVATATSSSLGVVQAGSGLNINEGILSVATVPTSITYPFALSQNWDLSEPDLAFSNVRFSNMNAVTTDDKNSAIFVGDSGLIAHDESGLWTRVGVGVTTKNLNDIAFGDGIYIIVGNDGTILRSKDKLKWEKITTTVTTRLNGVTWTGVRFIIVGDGGVVLHGLNGRVWTQATVPNSTSMSVVTSHDDISLAIAVGANGSVWASTDHGMSWGNKSLGISVNLQSACYVKKLNVFILVGLSGKIYSYDHVANVATEKTSGTTEALRDVYSNRERIIAVGNGSVILESSNAELWTKQVFSATYMSFGAVTYAKKWIGVGSIAIVLRHENDAEWKYSIPPTMRGLASYAKIGDIEILGGQTGGVYVGNEDIGFDFINLNAGNDLLDIAYGEGVVAFAGGVTTPGRIFTSSIASEYKTWLNTQYSAGPVNTCTFNPSTGMFGCIGTAGGKMRKFHYTTPTIIVTEDSIMDSTTIMCGKYKNGVYYFCGASGRVFIGATYASLVQYDTGLGVTLNGIDIGENEVVVVGTGGKIASASLTNLSVWTERSSGVTDAIVGIKYQPKAYVAITGTKILISETGSSWRIVNSPTSFALLGVYNKVDEFVITGVSGAIVLGDSFKVQDVSISGISSTDVGVADVILTRNIDTSKLEKEEWAKVDMIDTVTGGIKVTCMNDAPNMALSCQLKV